MGLKIKYIASIFFIVLATTPTIGQRVGVVLSGGGAKGVTHIGVLKALEENNIPIDYIAGTSMGAIIGGLYACGYSPDEIEKLFTSAELQNWITGGSGSKFNYYFKADNPNASWQIFKITFDSVLRIKLPPNIISPYELDFKLLEIFAEPGAAAEYNFDDLYIPFRCVASDVFETKSVVFRDGQVDKAIRASMTFPLYLKPIKINGKLMFDGGMYNNFPVDVMQNEFEPEIIIGCKAASNYGPPRDDDIISQIQSMLMANTNYSIDEKNGVLIVPNLKPINLMDFSNTRAFIDSGYIATLEHISKINELLKIQEPIETKDEKRNQFYSRRPSFKIGNIHYRGINSKQEIYLNRLIRKRTLLAKLERSSFSKEENMNQIKKQYYKILAEDQIESVSPELIYNSDSGYYDMFFNIDKSTRLETEIGGLVSSKTTNEIFFQLRFTHWQKYMLNLTGNAYLGRFHNSGFANIRFDIPGYIPLALELSYTLNGWNYFKTSTYFFEDEKPSYLVQQDNFWKFNVSTPITKYGKFSTEFSNGTMTDQYYQTNQYSRLDTTDKTTFNFYSPGVIFEINSLNRKQFPSKGIYMRICGRFISGDETNDPGSTSVDTTVISKYHNWLQLRFAYINYFKTSRIFNLGFHGSLTLSNKSFFNNYTSTVLSAPAFEPIPESKTLFLPQFRAHTFAAVGLMGILKIIKNLEFHAESYVFQPWQEIKKNDQNKAVYGKELSARYFIFSGSFVYHAAFGPISMCLNYYDQANEPFSFNINIGFFIFNKRPFQ
ncbi:MAG: patatin-like phospholipase family protein [Bacteroidales bacterium]|nr:patatin-like phospholipase family protein [Bacteroidales bacterium]